MPVNEKMSAIIFEQSGGDDDITMPDTSFFDDLNAETLKLVELIMTAGTGQKDILRKLKLNASTCRRF